MATFTRLRSGEWGIRGTRAADGFPRHGMAVTVYRRDGSSTVERVDRVTYGPNRDGVWIASIARAAAPAAVPATVTVTVAAVEEPHPAVFDPAGTGPAPAHAAADDGTFPLVGGEDTDGETVEPANTPPENLPHPSDDPPAPEGPDLEKLVETRPWMLFYDIPDRAEIANPSGRLYGRAVRLNLSCWVMPEGNIPYNLVNELNEAGASAYVMPCDPRAAKTLAAAMTDALRREIADAIRRAERSRADAERKLAAENGLSAEEREERLRERADSVVERMGDLLANLEAAAAMFGLPTGALGMTAATRVATTVRDAMHARAAIYAESVKRLRAAGGVTGAALAVAAARDMVPAGVLADGLRDAGETAAADALAAAFDPDAA